MGVRASAPAAALALICGAAEARERAPLRFTLEGGPQTEALAWMEGGEIAVDSETLAALGVRAPQGAGPHALGRIPGLSYRLDAAAGAVRLDCEAACYAPQILHAQGPGSRTPAAPAIFAVMLHYDLAFTHTEGRGHAGGLFDASMSWRAGPALEGDFLADEARGAVRLNSALRFDFPDRRFGARLGDALSAPGAWGSSVRYAGIKLATDFTLDPRFVRFPTPQLSGSAALPAAIDLYVDGALRETRRAGAGPFTIDEPPIVAGAGVARLVVTDVLGRQQIASHPFYVAPSLLKSGLADFSFDAGFLRRNFGVRSADYRDGAVAFTYRRGVTDALTAEARAEAGAGARNAGFALAGASYLGEAEAAVAFSAEGGRLARAGWRRSNRFWSAALSLEAGERSFSRLGAPAPRRRETASLGLSAFPGGGLSLAFVRAVDRAGGEARVWSADYAPALGRRARLGLSISVAERPRHSAFAGLSLSAPFGDRGSAAAFAGRDVAGDRYGARAAVPPPDAGGLGWRLEASAGGAQRIDAAAAWRAGAVESEAAFSQANGRQGMRLGARGGVFWLGDRLYAARAARGGGAALVTAAPGMAVYLDNRIVAHADEHGRALVATLRPHEDNRVSIDPDAAPSGARVGVDALNARPGMRGAVLARFPIRRETGRWVTLLGPDGALAPQGLLLNRTGEAAAFFVGAGGRAYLADAPGAGALEAVIAGTPCRVDLAAPEDRLQCR